MSALRPGEQRLDADNARYVARVLRLGPADTFVGFDPETRTEADVRLVQLAGKTVLVEVGPLRPAELVSALSVTLIQAFGKGDKVDQVVRDATELGAARVIVVTTSRTVVKPQEASGRLERWRTIATQAARQCGRGDVPSVEGPQPLEAAVARLEGACWALAPGATRSIGAALTAWDPRSPLSLLVGPEGGFEPAELALLEARGFLRVGFGPFVLRTETAATAVLGAVLARAFG
jgi:16S rRNA (uracil1498-N3)-methyltransferase